MAVVSWKNSNWPHCDFTWGLVIMQLSWGLHNGVPEIMVTRDSSSDFTVTVMSPSYFSESISQSNFAVESPNDHLRIVIRQIKGNTFWFIAETVILFIMWKKLIVMSHRLCHWDSIYLLNIAFISVPFDHSPIKFWVQKLAFWICHLIYGHRVYFSPG